MTANYEAAATKAFEDLKSGREHNDLSAVVKDVENARKGMSPKEYDKFLQSLNDKTATILPNMEIAGTFEPPKGEHSLTITNKQHDYYKSVDLHHASDLERMRPTSGAQEELRQARGSVCRVIGDFEITTTNEGELKTVKDKDGNSYYKGPDGKWSSVSKDGIAQLDSYENMKIDQQGNLSFDMNRDHVIRHSGNGGIDHYDKVDNTYWHYDTQAHAITETSSGDGRVRKYHYDKDGKIDQIDGNLGHWDRTRGKDGKTEWVNSNDGSVWKGEMELDILNNLEFRAANGVKWTFGADGKDTKHK